MQHINCVQSPLPSRGDQATASQITQYSKISYKRWTSGVHETVMAVDSLNRKTTYCTFDTSERSCSWIEEKSKLNSKKKSSSHQQRSSGESQLKYTERECENFNKTVHKRLKQKE